MTDQQSRYTRVAIALHWIIAALIIINFLLAAVGVDAPKAEHDRLFGVHMATGILVQVLSVVWIIWRMFHPRPPFEPGIKPWEAALAKVVHALFYVLVFALPFTGWLMVSLATGGLGVDMYGIFQWPGLPVGADRNAAGTVHELHEILAISMFVLFLLHAGGALKHRIIDRDGTLARMLPFLRR